MTVPDYYAILGITPSATGDEVKTAYKRKSLLCHPDRVPPGPDQDEKRKRATVEFQAVADAFYTLSDPGRRSAYDRLRRSGRTAGGGAAGPGAGGFPPGGFDFFRSAGDDEEQPDAEGVFGNVFEEMLRPEVGRHFPLWTYTGAAAGAVVGFIAGNLPGAAVGALAGNRLGAVRDAKGKAVYEVFRDLGADQKAEVLKGLAAKVFGMSGIGGSK